jgi:methionyl-tRNA formyltransferase
MGTPDFALPSLEELHKEFEIVGVITQPDKPAGRGQRPSPPPVKKLALELGLKVFQPEKKSQILPIVESLGPQCVVVVAYGKILPPEVIKLPRYGCVNLHASLLPAYRGSAPIQRALMAGERLTGNSIMLMDEGMDTGPLLATAEEPIYDEDDFYSLSRRLSLGGAKLLTKTLKDWFEGRIEPYPQGSSCISYAPPIQKEELRICWKAPAESVRDRVRGIYPNCYTLTERGERLKVLKVRVLKTYGEPGYILKDKGLVVACGEGAVEILELISPKGKLMSGEEFLRGYRLQRLL